MSCCCHERYHMVRHHGWGQCCVPRYCCHWWTGGGPHRHGYISCCDEGHEELCHGYHGYQGYHGYHGECAHHVGEEGHPHEHGHRHGGAECCGHGRRKMSPEHLARYLAHVKAEIEDLEKRIQSLEKAEGKTGGPTEREGELPQTDCPECGDERGGDWKD